MDIRIFSRDLVFLDVYDGAQEIFAEDCFASAGTFSLCVPIADAARFPVEGIVDIPAFGGYVIERIEKDAASMTAQIGGRGVLSYFARRALSDTVHLDGAAEDALLRLAAAYGAEVLGATLHVQSQGFFGDVNAVLGGRTLLSAMQAVCDQSGLGMRLSVCADRFTFLARARQEKEEILSRGVGHLSGGTRRTDMREYANRVIVGAAGGRRVTVDAAGLFADGFDDAAQPLREKYYYAEDFSADRYASEEERTAALTAEGKRVLARCRPVTEVRVAVSSDAASRLSVAAVYSLEDEVLGITARALCMKKSVRINAEGTVYEASLSLVA